MKAKKEFIEDVYFQCRAIMCDMEIGTINTKDTQVNFYLDEGNETLQIEHNGRYEDVFKMDVDTAFEYAKIIYCSYLDMEMEDVEDERLSNFKFGIGHWNKVVDICINDMKDYFTKNKENLHSIRINLYDNLYLCTLLEQKIEITHIEYEDNELLLAIQVPIFLGGRIVDRYKTKIKFNHILQDISILTDVMNEFYRNTRHWVFS